MGHQVNFYISPTDTVLLERTLRKSFPLVVVHDRSASRAPRVVDSLDVEEDGKPWLYLYLARPDDLDELVMQHVPAQGYWALDVIKSPVIEFNRCFFNDQILRRGRVYYVDGFYGSDKTWVEKSESFRRWARSILSTTKKSLKRHGSDYIGHDALSWLGSSGGKLVQ